MKIGDKIVFSMVLLTICLTWLFFSSNQAVPGRNLEYAVSIAGEEVHRGVLSGDNLVQSVTISLDKIRPDYEQPAATLEIRDGKVRVLPMSLELCPEEICHKITGAISRHGQTIVCMPNLLIVRIEARSAETDQTYDVLSH